VNVAIGDWRSAIDRRLADRRSIGDWRSAIGDRRSIADHPITRSPIH